MAKYSPCTFCPGSLCCSPQGQTTPSRCGFLIQRTPSPGCSGSGVATVGPPHASSERTAVHPPLLPHCTFTVPPPPSLPPQGTTAMGGTFCLRDRTGPSASSPPSRCTFCTFLACPAPLQSAQLVLSVLSGSAEQRALSGPCGEKGQKAKAEGGPLTPP